MACAGKDHEARRGEDRVARGALAGIQQTTHRLRKLCLSIIRHPSYLIAAIGSASKRESKHW